jgi:hypothetical protein
MNFKGFLFEPSIGKNLAARSVMPRGLWTTRRTHQHQCQIELQPRRRKIGKKGIPCLDFGEFNWTGLIATRAFSKKSKLPGASIPNKENHQKFER